MKIIIQLLIFLVSIQLFGQTVYENIDQAQGAAATLKGNSGPENVNWIENGKRYSYKGGNGAIKLFDPATQKEELIFEVTNKTFPGTSTPFDYESFEWSRDFKFLVFRTNVRQVWRNSGHADYYLYSLSDKSLRLIAKDAYTAQLSPDGTKVGYERNGNLFVMELISQQEKQLTNDAKDFFYNGRFGWAYEEEWGLVQAWEWSPNGKQIAYWQSDEREVPIYRYTNYQGFKESYKEIPYPRPGDKNPYVKIGTIDIETGNKRWMHVECGEGYIPRIYWTATENQLAIVQMNRKQNHVQLYFANSNTGEEKKIFEEKSDSWVEVFSFGAHVMHYFYFPPNAKEFFWKSDREGWSHIYRYDYAGKLMNQVTLGNWEVSKVLYTDDKKKQLYYLSTEVSPLELHLFVIGYDGKNKRKLTNGEGNHTIDFGGQYYIDRYSNVSLPKQVDLCDVTGKLIKKIESNQKSSDFIKAHVYFPLSTETFTAEDGQKIDIGIIKPYHFDPTKRYPVILDVYGGPEHQSVFNQFETNGWRQFMAQSGFVIVTVNNRGSAGYGAAFKRCVYGKLGYWESYDFAQAAKYMATKAWVDKNNMGIKGHSYGGFSSAYTVMTHPDIFKAVIIASPVTDWRLYDAIYTERFMGVLPESKEAYDKSSVLPYVKNLKAKALVIHSTFDDNVHVRNSMQLLSTLIDLGIDADVRLYQYGGHGVGHNKVSYNLVQKQYAEFMIKNLLN